MTRPLHNRLGSSQCGLCKTHALGETKLCALFPAGASPALGLTADALQGLPDAAGRRIQALFSWARSGPFDCHLISFLCHLTFLQL